MQKKKIVIANWKMNPVTSLQAKSFFTNIKKTSGAFKNVTSVVAAPFVYLPELSKLTSASLSLGAQNVSPEKEGAFTGEISVGMLSASKVKYVIVGHSERRAMGETNEFISRKIKSVLVKKMTPVLCVGELNRDHGMWYLGAIKTQIEECLAGIPKNSVSNIVIAYEPVWAISSTADHKDATPEDCREMYIYIQKVLSDMFGPAVASKTSIIYGGSVSEKIAQAFVTVGQAEGLLVGHASLNPKSFIKILKIVNES